MIVSPEGAPPISTHAFVESHRGPRLLPTGLELVPSWRLSLVAESWPLGNTSVREARTRQRESHHTRSIQLASLPESTSCSLEYRGHKHASRQLIAVCRWPSPG